MYKEMNKKMLFMGCAPLISGIYARSAITPDEKQAIIGSLKNDPENRQARSILASKLLECPDSPDIRMLYEKIRE